MKAFFFHYYGKVTTLQPRDVPRDRDRIRLRDEYKMTVDNGGVVLVIPSTPDNDTKQALKNALVRIELELSKLP